MASLTCLRVTDWHDANPTHLDSLQWCLEHDPPQEVSYVLCKDNVYRVLVPIHPQASSRQKDRSCKKWRLDLNVVDCPREEIMVRKHMELKPVNG